MGQTATDTLAQDLTEAAGKPIVTVTEAIRLTGLGKAAIWEAINTGQLALLQRAPKGNVSILVRDLAEWLLTQRHYRAEE